ncbi:hypothetical protein Scep_012934 [Stephania cephalantha]|uniref:Uncharacterized protein n=1 Tax=Stephania cephalantha TaxID=152367 RepID=A0AAP0PAA5_9MAGN
MNSLLYGFTFATISSRAQYPPSDQSRRVTMINKTAQVSHSHSHLAHSMNAEVHTYLKQAIPQREPLSIYNPMHHLVNTSPPTPASALCLAAFDLVGGPHLHRDQAIAAASALHLFHAAAYTHEHLPLSDRPNYNGSYLHRYSPNIELLIGDGIMPFGYELLAKSDVNSMSSEKILRVILEMAQATGARGAMSEGTSERKGGVLSGCGAACGAVLGGGSEEEIERLREIGRCVGMVNGMLKLVHGDSYEFNSGSPDINKEDLLKEVERLRSLGVDELESLRDGRSDRDDHLQRVYDLLMDES